MVKASYRWLFGITLLLLPLLVAGRSLADGAPPIHLVVDDQALVSDVAPVNVHGRLLLPARLVAERLGGTATWDPDHRQVRIVRQLDVILLTIDSAEALVNGETTKLDVPAILIDGRTMVPLRFVATALGATVRYDDTTHTAFVWRRPTTITRMTWEKEVGQARVTLGLSEPLTYSLQQSQSSVVVDLYPAVIHVAQPVQLLTDPLVKSVALFQSDQRRAHLTIDAYRSVNPAVTLSADGKQLTLTMPYQVTDLQYVQDGNVPTVLIPTTGPVRYKTDLVSDPDRLVVDIPGAKLAPGVPAQVAGGALVQRIRASQFTPDSVRVVLDLTGQQPYQVAQTDAGLLIRFVPIITGVSYRLRDNGTADLTVQANLPLTYTVAPPSDGSNLLIITIPGSRTYLPDDLTAGPLKIHLTRHQGHDGLQLAVQLPYYLGHQVLDNGGPGALLSLITSPIYGKKIWIDAGHGGDDPGAIGPGGDKEKDLTLAVALRLQRLLQRAGATVYMTRTGDAGPDFRKRPDLVNAVNPDMFISIHMNAEDGHKASGTETYYWYTNAKSKDLAQAIQQAMAASVGLVNRGIDAQDYYVVKYTKAPSCLVEVGFLSNPTEEVQLANPIFEDKVADALRQGIFQFFLGH